MEDVFDKLVISFEAFEKLVVFCSKVPKYSLVRDLERMFEGKGNIIVKDFIKWGKKFVQEYHSVDEAEESKKGEVEEELVEMSNSAGEDLNTSSVNSECPYMPVDVLLPPPSLCLSSGWGALLPSSAYQELHLQPKKVQLWRSWESGDVVQDKRSDENEVKGRTEASMDHSSSCWATSPFSLDPFKASIFAILPKSSSWKIVEKSQ